MILFLGPESSAIFAWLRVREEVVQRADAFEALAPTCVVSHGYRHVLKPQALAAFGCLAINVHISYLPWNRGADPNLWSHLEGTKKGVSIHVIDAGIDTGPLVAQREVRFGPDETLRTSYDRLQAEALALFSETWPRLRSIAPLPQPAGGSIHRKKDRDAVAHLLTAGWDTPLRALTRG